MKQLCRFVAALAATAALGADAPPSPTKDGANHAVLQKPVRLTAVNAVIDSGPQWAHSGPCLHDVDRDGRRDLLVGDFSGLFRFYRNQGTNAKPSYARAVNLQAGGADAKVPIY